MSTMKSRLKKLNYLIKVLVVMVSLISVPTNAQWLTSDSSFYIGSFFGAGLDFPSENAAYITGGMGILYKSVDGGVSWDNHYDFGPFSNLRGPNFISADTGFVHANAGIQRTFDGGASWELITSSWGQDNSLPISSIKIIDEILFGTYVNDDTVFLVKSIDFGNSFLPIFEHVESGAQPFLYSFIDTLTGFFINPLELEQVYKTTDGFLTIDTTDITTGPISLESKFHYTDLQNGYLFGDWGSQSNPSRTWNAGGFFFPIDLDGFGVLPVFDMDFNSSKIFASSLYGQIFYLDNSSQTWIEQTTPTTDPVYAISFLDENNGIAISANTVLYTQNGGVLGLDEFTISNSFVSLFPNPTTDEFNIKVLENIQIEKIRLVDLSGKQVKDILPTESSISITDLPIGIYFVEFVTEKGTVVERIVKY